MRRGRQRRGRQRRRKAEARQRESGCAWFQGGLAWFQRPIWPQSSSMRSAAFGVVNGDCLRRSIMPPADASGVIASASPRHL